MEAIVRSVAMVVGLWLVPVCPPASAVADCVRQAQEFGKWLRAVEDAAVQVVELGVPKMDLVSLKPSTGFQGGKMGVNVRIDKDELSVEGQVASGKWLGIILKKFREKSRDEVYVWISPDASWNSIVEVASNLVDAGITQPWFMFAANWPDRPKPTSIDGQLKKIQRLSRANPNRTVALFDLLRKQFDSCPDLRNRLPTEAFLRKSLDRPVEEVKKNIAGREPPDRHLFSRFMQDILSECTCSPDMEAIKSIFWNLHTPRPVVALPVRLAAIKDRKARALKTKAGDAWQQAHRLLLGLDSRQPVRLQVR
jgi:hypothetical protein